MPKKSKRTEVTDYSKLHIIERALERYGVTLDSKDYSNMNDLVRKKVDAGEEPLGSDSTTNVYSISYKDVSFICVWHRKDAKLTTLLPKDTKVLKKK